VRKRSAKAVVLDAVLRAADRGEPMPLTKELAHRAGCSLAAVTMALGRLEADGVLRRVSGRGKPRRVVEVVATGRRTA
jgi:DNA-binding MarR family transcriptional regulator